MPRKDDQTLFSYPLKNWAWTQKKAAVSGGGSGGAVAPLRSSLGSGRLSNGTGMQFWSWKQHFCTEARVGPISLQSGEIKFWSWDCIISVTAMSQFFW